MSDFNDSRILSSEFRKILKYQISWISVQWEPSCYIRTDRRTLRNLRVGTRLETPACFTTSSEMPHAERHKIPTDNLVPPHTTHVSPTDRQMDFVSTWRCERRRLSVTDFLSSGSSDTGLYLERFLRNRPSTRVLYDPAGLVSQNPQDINVLTRVPPLCTLGSCPQGTVSHQT